MELSLNGKDLIYYYDEKCAAPSCDSFLLAYFFHNIAYIKLTDANEKNNTEKKLNVLDLGAGAGLISLLVAGSSPANITGLEISSHCAGLFQKNIENNNFSDRLKIITGDVVNYRTHLPPEFFDAVLTNPPYHKISAGRRSSINPLAKSGNGADIFDFCKAAAFALKNKGSFYISFPAKRLCDLLISMREYNIEPKRLRFVRHSAAHEPFLVLAQGTKSGGAGLKTLPEIILFEENGQPTAESNKIYGYT